jgi:nicotinic acid mononucleotide adenylyltransferase
MRKIIKISLLIVLISWFSCTAQGLILEDLMEKGILESTLVHKKIGYYIGSFDPLHKGHEAVAKLPIQQGLCDYVLIFPAWGGDEYKSRVDVRHRLEMIYSVFADHPSVIVTKLSPKELQQALTCPDESKVINDKPAVKSRILGVEFIGMVGSDTALSLQANDKALSTFMKGIQIPEKYYEQTVGGVIALPVNQFIVSQREGDDLTPLEGKIGDRPIIAVLENKSGHALSSTAVKKTMNEKQSIDEMVSPSVREIMTREHLYQIKK